MTKIIEVDAMETAAVDKVHRADSALDKLREEVEYLVVKDQPTVDRATQIVRGVKGILKDAEADRKFLVDPLNNHVKAINARFKPLTTAATDIERLGKNKIISYQSEVEKKRREEERIEREKEEKERRRKEELARKAQERGDHEKAEEHRRKADEVPVAVVEAEATVAEGSHTVTTWNADVTSLEDLILAVAATISAKRIGEDLPVMIPTEAIHADEKYLRGVAKGVKDTVRWPGVRFYPTTDLAVRG